MRGLHRLCNHSQQVVRQVGQIGLATQGDREALQGARGIELCAVEAAVNRAL